MQSFSSKVKDEISCAETNNLKSAYAELLGMLIFAGKFKEGEFLITYENKKAAEKLASLLAFAAPKVKWEKITLKTTKKTLLKINLDNQEKLCRILKDPKKEDLPENLGAFLAGAFLSCGSITNPETNYHLEFHLTSNKLCELILSAFKLFKKIDFNPKTIKRRNSYSVYIKENEKIEDFLVLVGASMSAMQFMQVKMIKEVRNNINRTTNFETANLSKTTNSASRQIKAIKRIISRKKLEKLPNALKQTASLRLEHPYASLKELAELHEGSVTRSGVNHRLEKLIEISENL